MLRLRTLGTIDLADDDGRSLLPLLGQPKRLALLVYLATASPPGFHRRDVLVMLFWPELDQRHARAALRQSMHVLRASLDGPVVVGRGAEAIGVDPDRLWCDVRAFEELLAAGRPAPALELYRGSFLAGFHLSGVPEFDAWAEGARERLRDRAATAARWLARHHERDAPELAAQWARQAAGLAPESEAVLRQLMTALCRAGDQVGAVRAFAEFVGRAARDYGVAPSPETQRLARELLADGGARPRDGDARRADVRGGPPARRPWTLRRADGS